MHSSLMDQAAQGSIRNLSRGRLTRLLTTKDGFTMEGINADFTLKVAHLKPAVSVDTQVQELQQQFVKMQWETE